MEGEKNEDSRELTSQKQRTIVISKDNNCQKPQMNISNIKSSVDDQYQSLRVYIDLDSFENQTFVSLETLEALQSAENIEFFVGTRRIYQKHKKNTQSAFLTCLSQLSEHLKILKIFSQMFTNQIDLALLGTTLSRFKGLQVISLDFLCSDSIGIELCKVFQSIGDSMSDLKELEIKMKRQSSSCKKQFESLGLAINQLQRLNKLRISVYSEFPFVEEGIDNFFKGIESACGLTELVIDIRAILRREQLLSYQRMLRGLKNLQMLKLNIQTSTDVEEICIKKLLSTIFNLAQLKYLELETRSLGYLNQHDIEDLVKDHFHKLNYLEGVQLRVFDFNRIEIQFSSLSIFTNISQENNLKKLKKLDLNISRRQYLPKPRIADVISQFDSLEELTLVIERGYYGWLQEQEQVNQKIHIFNDFQEIQEKNLEDGCADWIVENPPETAMELLNSIGSQKKIKKLDLLFETGNIIGNQGWEALSHLEELSDLSIKVGDNSGLSDTYLAAITKCLFQVRNLQVLSLTVGSLQSTSEKGWNMLFKALGKLTELQRMYLWIEKHNEVTDYSVDLLASSIQLLRNLVSLEIIFGSNNISNPATFLQLFNSFQFLSKLRTLTLVDMTSRRTISEKTHQQTEMTQQTQNNENQGFNIINLSLRGLRDLENLNIYFETGQLADLQFSQCLQLCGTISDLEDLKELDINISGKYQVIGVMSSTQKKQLAEYLQSQNSKQKQNPNTGVFLKNQAQQKQASQEQEELVLTTAKGICFVFKINENSITNDNSDDTNNPAVFGHSWQFPKDAAKLKLSLLDSLENRQITRKISCLSSGLRNLQICRKISISFKNTNPPVLPQQSFDSLIQSICIISSLSSIDLQLATTSLTEETSQNLSTLSLHLVKAKLHFTFDPLDNSTLAVTALVKSFILNTNLQNLDIKCYELFNIFLRKIPNPQKIENFNQIQPLSPNMKASEQKDPSKPSYWTSLEIISPNDLPILLQNDNDNSNSLISFIHSKYLGSISHIISLLNDPGVSDKFDKLLINLSSTVLQGIQNDLTIHQLFQGIKAQSTLNHLQFIVSNGFVFNTIQIRNLSETISLMNNLETLDLYLKSDESFNLTEALNVVVDLQSIAYCTCTIKSTVITLRTSKYFTQSDCPILSIQPMNFTISREKNQTDNCDGDYENHNNLPLLCLQLSDLFNWFNYLSTPLTSIFIDTNYFLSSNEQNTSQNFNNFKHVESLKKLTLLVSYSQLNKDIKQLFSMFGNSNVLESLDISISELIEPSFIKNSDTFLGEELRYLKNLKNLSLKVSNYSFQNDDLRELSLSLRDMPNLNYLNIEICKQASLSIDALTNLAESIGTLQKLDTLAISLSVEKSIPSEPCLRVLKFLSQSAQEQELNVGRKRSIVVNILGYFSYKYNSFMLRSCSKSIVQITSKSQRNYEISSPVPSQELAVEKKDLELLVNSILEVFTEEATIIERLTINLKNDEQLRITTNFLNALVGFLRKTGNKLSHLELQIKDLYDTQLQEICNNLLVQTNKTNNYFPLHIETVTILVDLPGVFDSYERFLNHLYQYLESTTTLRLSLDLPQNGLERLGKLAQRKMKRLVRLQQSKYQFY